MQFMQAYVGYHVPASRRPFPEYSAAAFPHSLFESSPLYTGASFKSAALSFRRAHFQLSPVDVPTANYDLTNSSLWYSTESRVAAEPLLAAAEAARDRGDLDWAYGAAVNPAGAYPESSASGQLPLPPLLSENDTRLEWPPADISRTSGFLFSEAHGLPLPLEDEAQDGFGLTMVEADGTAVELAVPLADTRGFSEDARGDEGTAAGSTSVSSLNTRVRLWHVIVVALVAVLFIALATAFWCCLRRRKRPRSRPPPFAAGASPRKLVHGEFATGAAARVVERPNAGGATGSGRGVFSRGVFSGVNELQMSEEGGRSAADVGDAALAAGIDLGKAAAADSPPETRRDGGIGAGVPVDLSPSLQPSVAAASTVDTGCGSGVVSLGLCGGPSGALSAGPSGGLIGGGWAHMGGVSRCFVPNSVALAALQDTGWLQEGEEAATEEAEEDMDAETGAARVAGKVALAVKEMQGALQTELQDDHLQLLGVLGRGGFGVVYHGVNEPQSKHHDQTCCVCRSSCRFAG